MFNDSRAVTILRNLRPNERIAACGKQSTAHFRYCWRGSFGAAADCGGRHAKQREKFSYRGDRRTRFPAERFRIFIKAPEW